jgi:3-dehydroquinate synthetase
LLRIAPAEREQRCTILELRTHLPVSYRVLNVDRPIFDIANTQLADMIGNRRVLVVADERVVDLYGAQLTSYFERHTTLAGIIAMAGNESEKHWGTVERICNGAIQSGLERSSVIVGIGGGIVMDTAGVAASLYRRGVDFLRVPTTLIGIVDVAVGIKHGFNFTGKKNALGTFYPPIGAVADRRFLKTLEGRHLRCGLAEILKLGIVREPQLFELIEDYGGELIATGFSEPSAVADEIILQAQTSMMEELECNLYEQDKRRLADFGHTISPTLEAATNYALHHGEAVAIDMLLSAAVAVVNGICAEPDFERIRRVYEGAGLPVYVESLTPDLVRTAFEETRRHRGGALNLVVPTRVGNATFVQDLTASQLRNALALMR